MNVKNELLKLREVGYFKHFEDKGDYYLVTCPFHKGGAENTPSMGINKARIQTGKGYLEEGYVHCFGCDYTNRFTKFLAELKGVSEFDILKAEKKDKLYESSRDFNLCISRDKEVKEIELKPMSLSKEGREYLNGRKVTDDVIELFEITSDSYNNVVFPIRNKQAVLVATQSRNIKKKSFYNTKDFDKEHCIYGLSTLLNSKYIRGDKLYVVESIIDCLTLWSWGFKAVSLMGAIFSDYHIKELIKLPYEVVLALDNDEVGKKAMSRVAPIFATRGKKISLIKWGNTIEKDINDLNKEKFLKIIKK